MFNNNILRIAIVSDLHIEFLDQYGKDKRQLLIQHILNYCDQFKVDLLVNAGDTHSKRRELNSIVYDFESKVPDTLTVLGNHDYYKPGGMDLIYDKNVISNFKDVKILHGTMWTDFQNDHVAAVIAQANIPDFKYIPLMTPSYMINQHQNYSSSLSTKPNICLTHFATNVSLIADKFKGNKLNPYFISHMHDHFLYARVKVSIYGHTHTKTFQEIDGITYINNAFGYPGENYSYIDSYDVTIIDYNPETHKVTRVN